MDDDYLRKDFDIGKLTIPKIKKILIENGITEFPTRAKKDQLIEIFKENIGLIRKKKKEEKKKEESRSKNIYQEGRSSIIELEVNKRDGEGGEYTSGRYGDKDVKGGKDVDIKDVKGDIKDHKDQKGEKFISINKQTPSQTILPHPSPPSHNSSFLDSLTAHLRSTSRRRKSLEDIGKDKGKVIVDVDSGVSDTLFFNSQNDINKKDDKRLIIPSPNHTPSKSRSLYFLLIPSLLLLIPLYFLLPYCTNGDLICLPPPKNGKVINGKLICDNGFILKKSFLREKCIKDSKEIRMLKKINSIINELEILKGDYKYGLVKDYKKKISEVIGDGREGNDKDTRDINKEHPKKGIQDKEYINSIIEILRHSSKVKFDKDLIYAVNHKITLKSFIRHYSLKAFYLLLLISLITLIFYIFYKRRQGILEKKYSSQKIVKEILNILLRQLIISSKNTRFPGFVYVDHLKDVFLVEKGLWEMVKENVEKNSNVKKGEIENKETWEWVGPYVENGV
ncbi:histone H1 [Nosema bombycis CQ1]|uniref:Histone H1 n=2 Tax=Nosema bombycis TaxID=27978 RepID=R0MKH9_NOSB1|nr:histone H1 [Nosema bombycis]EOB14750.1 histone H1 [Nosema bombycis CQ1]|eukprot:EOB14750.1 histone H1 [Nosema bombycis CQ1]